jgi:hypothetical protein
VIQLPRRTCRAKEEIVVPVTYAVDRETVLTVLCPESVTTASRSAPGGRATFFPVAQLRIGARG